MSIDARAARITLVLFDVDGVLTDGSVVLHSDGSESKRFDIKDGLAIVWAQRAGLAVGLLSARRSLTTQHRAAQLGILTVRQDVSSKLEAYEEILVDLGRSDAEVAYMGDDILDLPVMARVGLAAAPADAVPEVLRRAHWTSTACGGAGAARQLIEVILRAQHRWDEMIETFLATGCIGDSVGIRENVSATESDPSVARPLRSRTKARRSDSA